MKHLFASIRLIVALGMAGMMLSITACDREPAVQKSATPEAGSTSASVPATKPSSCVMTIDGVAASFPGARLRLKEENDEWTATFYSDDPAEAIRPDYQGNSFYLSMNLTGVEERKLNKAKWTLQNPERAEGDSPEGIFIGGQQQQLRPLSVRAEFEDGGQIVIIKLSGDFQAMQKGDLETRTLKKVQGRIEAACERE